MLALREQRRGTPLHVAEGNHERYGTPRLGLHLYSQRSEGDLKKCASCTKDLPDAALHCVFCGAKQPPAPAVAGSVAKTVMGHSSNEVIEALKAQAARNPAPAAAPYTPPAPAPAPPRSAPMPPA